MAEEIRYITKYTHTHTHTARRKSKIVYIAPIFTNWMPDRKWYFTYMLIHQHLIRITIYHNLNAASRRELRIKQISFSVSSEFRCALCSRSARGCRTCNICFMALAHFIQYYLSKPILINFSLVFVCFWRKWKGGKAQELTRLAEPRK